MFIQNRVELTIPAESNTSVDLDLVIVIDLERPRIQKYDLPSRAGSKSGINCRGVIAAAW
jgi:hypothetical protein